MESIWIFLIGIGAGIVGATSGGAGLLTIPGLNLLGLPMLAAIATSRLGTLGLCLGSLSKYHQENRVNWKASKKLVPIAIAGTFIGTKIITSLNEPTIRYAIAIFLLASLPVLFLKKEFGVIKKKVSPIRETAGLLLYFVLMIYASAIGAGTGPLIFLVLVNFLGFTLIESNATDMVSWLLISLLSLTIFSFQGLVNYQLGIFLMTGMLLGGLLGAKIAVKIGNKNIKILLAIVVAILSFKILLSN